MAVLVFPFKDPNEVLDYVVDWSERLSGDTIANSSWTMPPGITKDSDSRTTTTTTIWLSGGTIGESYSMVCRIVTAGGRTMDQTCKIKIKEK